MATGEWRQEINALSTLDSAARHTSSPQPSVQLICNSAVSLTGLVAFYEFNFRACCRLYALRSSLQREGLLNCIYTDMRLISEHISRTT